MGRDNPIATNFLFILFVDIYFESLKLKYPNKKS